MNKHILLNNVMDNYKNITFFTSITLFCRTDNIMWNIPSFRMNVGNILHNNVGSTTHCYGYEQCYEDLYIKQSENMSPLYIVYS